MIEENALMSCNNQSCADTQDISLNNFDLNTLLDVTNIRFDNKNPMPDKDYIGSDYIHFEKNYTNYKTQQTKELINIYKESTQHENNVLEVTTNDLLNKMKLSSQILSHINFDHNNKIVKKSKSKRRVKRQNNSQSESTLINVDQNNSQSEESTLINIDENNSSQFNMENSIKHEDIEKQLAQIMGPEELTTEELMAQDEARAAVLALQQSEAQNSPINILSVQNNTENTQNIVYNEVSHTDYNNTSSPNINTENVNINFTESLINNEISSEDLFATMSQQSFNNTCNISTHANHTEDIINDINQQLTSTAINTNTQQQLQTPLNVQITMNHTAHQLINYNYYQNQPQFLTEDYFLNVSSTSLNSNEYFELFIKNCIAVLNVEVPLTITKSTNRKLCANMLHQLGANEDLVTRLKKFRFAAVDFDKSIKYIKQYFQDPKHSLLSHNQHVKQCQKMTFKVESDNTTTMKKIVKRGILFYNKYYRIRNSSIDSCFINAEDVQILLRNFITSKHIHNYPMEQFDGIFTLFGQLVMIYNYFDIYTSIDFGRCETIDLKHFTQKYKLFSRVRAFENIENTLTNVISNFILQTFSNVSLMDQTLTFFLHTLNPYGHLPKETNNTEEHIDLVFELLKEQYDRKIFSGFFLMYLYDIQVSVFNCIRTNIYRIFHQTAKLFDNEEFCHMLLSCKNNNLAFFNLIVPQLINMVDFPELMKSSAKILEATVHSKQLVFNDNEFNTEEVPKKCKTPRSKAKKNVKSTTNKESTITTDIATNIMDTTVAHDTVAHVSTPLQTITDDALQYDQLFEQAKVKVRKQLSLLSQKTNTGHVRKSRAPRKTKSATNK